MKLAFANVKVYANNVELFEKDTSSYDSQMDVLQESMLFVFNRDDLNGKNDDDVSINDITIESLQIGTMKEVKKFKE